MKTPIYNFVQKYADSNFSRFHMPGHKGMDFTCDMRTPIYATADAVVESAGWRSGYGYTVVLDHGFGYKTRYAHLRASLVKEGQMVKRGEHIAELGNTGRSQGPHIHYEVFYKNKTVNPLNYFNLDITPEEYSAMVKPVKTSK